MGTVSAMDLVRRNTVEAIHDVYDLEKTSLGEGFYEFVNI